MLAICLTAFPTLPAEHVTSLLRFNARVDELIRARKIGNSGQPWEFNLRDVMRCCEMLKRWWDEGDVEMEKEYRHALLDLVYVGRFRTEQDRQMASVCFQNENGELIFEKP